MSTPETPVTHPKPESYRTAAPYRGIAAASVGLGFFSLVVFWWFPFGLCLASVGFTLGVVSMIFGIRGGYRGENLALMGTILCSISIGGILFYVRGLNVLLWDH